MTQYVPVNFREPTAEDLSFIYNSWLRSYRKNSLLGGVIPGPIFFDNHKKLISGLMKESAALVACNPEAPEQIFGYVVFQPASSRVTAMHFLYVKFPYRRLGIAASLYRAAQLYCSQDEDLPILVTHITKLVLKLKERQRIDFVYNPYFTGMDNDCTQTNQIP